MRVPHSFTLLTCLLLASCISEPEFDAAVTPSAGTALSFAHVFDFKTDKTVVVQIKDLATNPSKYRLSYQFNGQEHPVLTKGGSTGTHEYLVVVPASVDQVTVKRQTAGGVETQQTAIINGTAAAVFDSVGGSTYASDNVACTDRLYAVNGQRGFYEIGLSGNDYTAIPLPELAGGGSIANALDQANGLVYYNVGTKLYQFNVATEEFSVAHEGNPFNGNYPRLTYKDGYFWMSNNTKMYKVDATTNAVEASYDIEGFVNNHGGGDLAFDSEDHLYLACFSGLYKFVSFEGSTATVTRISAENFPFQLTSMAIDRQDRIFVGTNDANSNLIQISKEDGSYQIVRTYDFKINDLTAWRCEDSDLSQQDTDNDGIIDELDDFPEDGDAAFATYTPSEIGMGSLAFEDLWPAKGDYDFNDLVVGYQFVLIENSDNQAVRMEIEITIRAVGAGNHNGFGMQLPIDESLIASVSGHAVYGSQVSLMANGLEAGQNQPTIIVFNDAFDHMKPANQGDFVNTVVGADKVAHKTFNLTVEFTQAIDPAPLSSPPFNPFIFNSMDRGREIHLAGYAPTSLADNTLFGTVDDNSISGSQYLSTDNTPWAINLIHTFRYPTEKSRIDQAYNYFVPWAQSGGLTYTDWYGDNSGYRNLSFIYLD